MKSRKKFDAYCHMITFQPNTILILFMLIFHMGCGIANKNKKQQTNSPSVIEENVIIEKPNPTEIGDTTSISEYYDVNIMAEFKGGDEARYKFIRMNLRYPKEAMRKGLEGRVTVQFVVWTDGSVRNVEILNPQEKLAVLETEAMRVVSLMGTQNMWKPATMKGKNVPVRFRMPIEFQL